MREAGGRNAPGEERDTGCSPNKLVSAELECKRVYLATFVSACIFVDRARGCLLGSVYMSKFACNLASWDEVGPVCSERQGGSGSACASRRTRRAWDL